MSFVQVAQDKLLGAKSTAESDSGCRQSPEEEVLEVTGTHLKSRRVMVDVGALREAGCVAEESQGRLFAGQYRKIKRQLIEGALASKSERPAAPEPMIVMVTSALPGDGKTFTSLNLALSLARERDVSVLLVDADVQKSDVSRLLGIGKERGLLDALNNEAIDIESLILRTNLPGLTLLASGTQSEGATELLSSKRMDELTAGLINRHPRRIVLVDAPPLLVTSEAPALLRIAGQVVLVVRAGKTPKRALQDTLQMFDEQQPVGLILNEAQNTLSQYYGYGYYGFEYGDKAPES